MSDQALSIGKESRLDDAVAAILRRPAHFAAGIAAVGIAAGIAIAPPAAASAPCIGAQTLAGVTFDLDALRRDLA